MSDSNPQQPEEPTASSPPGTIVLRESEEQFAQLVAGVRDYAVFLLDPHGHVLTWNAGAEQAKGYRADEIIGKHFSRFYPSDAVSSGWPAHELEVARLTGRFEDEGWRVRKDGSRFWASVVLTALRDEAGDVRGFLKITRDRTDRKQAEEKLKLSEERFRLLVEGVRDYAIFMLDPEGRVTTWNVGAKNLKGYEASEIVGEHFSRFYPNDAIDRGWPEEELRRAAADGSVEDEGWRIRKDGSQFWASVIITALRDDVGTLRGYAKVTRDLTARRGAEENAKRLAQEEATRKAIEATAAEMARQREQLAVTLASIGDAVIVTDKAGLVSFLNPIAAELTGWSLDDAMGLPLNEVLRIINEQTRQPVENPVDRVFRENRIVELANHTALVAKDGREVPIEDTAAPIRTSDGEIDGAVLVFRDVSQLRRASEAKSYLAAIVESSDDAIIGITLDGQIASWNRGAERLYGYSAVEVIGKPFPVLIPGERSNELLNLLDRIRDGQSIEHLETERIRKDGTRVAVSLTISPVRDRHGDVVGASKIARDITHRKEEDRRKNEFLALLAHELRNPLAPIRNGLQIMSLAGDDKAAIDQTREVMERQVHHLVRLVDDLLDVSRINSGKLRLRMERLPLREVVTHAMEVCSQAVKEQDHRLTVSFSSQPIFVDADKTRLSQAVCNLLTNAAKYSDPGSDISLTVEVDDADAVVRVTDNGIGIESETLPRVFDMFVQLEPTLERSQSGLGVGLTIVKRLVEMHGGSVEAHSGGRGKGSEFVIRLPRAVGGFEAPAVKKSDAHDHFSCRVLVIDDNVDAANTLTQMLKLMGNEVRTAHDGQTGLAAAKEFDADLILLDLGMPKVSGFDVAKAIRSEPWGQTLTLVALTGWGQEEDRKKSEEAGFDAHMVKPVEPKTLEKLLADVEAAKSSNNSGK